MKSSKPPAWRWKSATEPIDTQGPVGRMLLQLLGIFAEFERNLLIDRITAGFERKAARGEWLGGPPPLYGYDLDSTSKTLTGNTDEAAVVAGHFAKYVDERLGAKAIANWLDDTGRRTRSGNLWTGQAILRLLHPVYLGKIRHDETTYDGNAAEPRPYRLTPMGPCSAGGPEEFGPSPIRSSAVEVAR